jgi:hypothetical protein
MVRLSQPSTSAAIAARWVSSFELICFCSGDWHRWCSDNDCVLCKARKLRFTLPCLWIATKSSDRKMNESGTQSDGGDRHAFVEVESNPFVPNVLTSSAASSKHDNGGVFYRNRIISFVRQLLRPCRKQTCGTISLLDRGSSCLRSRKEGRNDRMQGSGQSLAFRLKLGANKEGMILEAKRASLAIFGAGDDFQCGVGEEVFVIWIQAKAAMVAFETGTPPINRSERMIGDHYLLRLLNQRAAQAIQQGQGSGGS